MEYIGFGVHIELDEEVTERIDPVIREMERLKKQMREVDKHSKDMNKGDYFYNSKRRREMRDYVSSMRSLDRVLMNISERFVRATYSANALNKATNRMQFAGNFNKMYSDIMRTQRMLGNMGFGESKQQSSQADMRAYQMLNYTIKDLEDRIKLTSQALREMEKSGDASKYPEQYRLAKESLKAFNDELARGQSLQSKLAQTHNYGIAQGIGKDTLYRPPSSLKDLAVNKLMGASMKDMAFASNLAYNSLDKTGKLMTGFGYTTMEARAKLATLVGQLQMAGMALTQFGTVAVGVAIAGLGMLLNKYEEASNVMHGRSLMPENMWRDSSEKMYDIAIDTGATMQQTGEAMALAWSFYGDNMAVVEDQTEKAMFMMRVHGISAEKSLRDVNRITKEYGVSNKQAWDMYVAGAVEARKATGKGFTGIKGIDRIMDIIDESPNKFKNLTGSVGEFNGAYEKMVDNYDKGIMEEIIEGVGALGGAVLAIVESNRPALEAIFGVFNDMSEGVRDFMRENEKMAKVIGIVAGITLAVVALAGPVALATAFLVRFRNVIGGVTETVTALSYGGFAVLSPQAKMAKDLMNGMVVAFARLPQTIFAGVLPAIYAMIRGIPGMLVQMMKVNPVMTALTFGLIAYGKNWLGFKDTVDFVIKSVKDTVNNGMGIVTSILSGEDVDFKSFDKWEQRVAKIYGLMKLAPKIAKDAWNGDVLSFDSKEMNLVKSLGIESELTVIASSLNRAKRFFDGFVKGIEIGWGYIKTVFSTAWKVIEPILDALITRIDKTIDFFAKFFGGGKDTSLLDMIKSTRDEMKETESMAETVGKAIGIMFAGFAGYKLAVKSIQLVITPFIALHGWINRVISRIAALQTALLSLKGPRSLIPVGDPLGPNAGKGKDGKTVYTGVPGGKDGKGKGKGKGGAFSKMGNFLGFGGKHDKKGPVGKVTEGIGKAIGGLGKFAGKLGGGLVKLIGGGFKLAFRAIPWVGWGLLAWDALTIAFKNWDSIKSAVSNFGSWLWDKFTELGSWIKENFIDKLAEWWNESLEKWQSYLTEKWESMKAKVGELYDGFVENWETYKQAVLDGVDMVKQYFIDKFEEKKARAIEIITGIWDFFKEKVIDTAVGMYNDMVAKWEEIKTEVINIVGGIVSDMLTKGKEMGTNIYDGIVGGLSGIGEKIISMIPKAVNVVVNFVKGATEGVKTGAKNFATKVTGGVVKGYSAIKDFVGPKHAEGGIIRQAHIGMVGEDGPEAIIPLSSGKRERALDLMRATSKHLGMEVVPEKTLGDVQGKSENTSSNGSGDTIFGDIIVHMKVEGNSDGKVDWGSTAKQLARNLIKEMKRIYEVEKMRGRGKNLTFEEFLERY